MTATPTVESLRPMISQITEAVFETMLDLTICPLQPLADEGPCAMTAAVYYVGAWNGALLLECSLPQAMQWGSRLMGIPAPIMAEDARDGLGELCNVLAGNLKPVLPPGVALSTPSVVAGADYSLSVRDSLRETLRFADPDGTFRVVLIIK
jgi:chemotaxis protein CheX